MLSYLVFILRHKWFVFQGCLRLRILWRGITHDLSKLWPSEFIAYKRYFYGGPYPKLADMHGDHRNMALIHGLLTQERVDEDFNAAWLKHIHRNDHHWQWWILREDDGITRVLPMSDDALREMIADWDGASRAIRGARDASDWYLANRQTIIVHADTRAILDGVYDAYL